MPHQEIEKIVSTRTTVFGDNTQGLLHERRDMQTVGLRWLASRGAAASFDALVADLAAQAQPGQFVARLNKLVSELPLPQTLPSAAFSASARGIGQEDCRCSPRARTQL